MKNLIYIIFFLALPNSLFSQHHNGGYLHSDSLETVTISGNVIVEDSAVHPMRYLDEDSDGTADFILNFGPYWYEPDSSDAERPSHGDYINLTGGLNNNSEQVLPEIIVYEINDQFWRDPFFASWNNMGTHNHFHGGHHEEGSGYYGFGWQHDTLETVSLTGIALVDTTYFANHYYLDMNEDGIPDFILNFGPPWYVPASEIGRPLNGDQVSVIGGKLNDEQEVPMIIVYELNGELWRDSSSVGRHFGGGWFNQELNGSMQFHAPFDTSDIIIVNEGWRNFGPGGGHMMPDSLFCQILEINPENLQNNNNFFAGYEIQMFRPDGSSGMMGNRGMGGGSMHFANDLQFQLHYSDTQLEYYNVDEETITVKYWDDQANDWLSTNFEIDKQKNLVSFSSSDINNYLVLAANKLTDVSSSEPSLPGDFILEQNYPNPFNPSTTIGFRIKKETNVRLNVFNVLGEKVSELINQRLSAGNYEVDFVAGKLPSGLYFYELNTDSGNITKVMVLIR
jgi:hypothetical protein